MVNRITSAIAIIGGSAIIACSNGTEPNEPFPASVEVVVLPDTFQIGVAAEATARILDSNGNQIEEDVVWASADTSIAIVFPTGLVVGRAIGTTFIRGTFRQLSDSAQVTVLPLM